MTIKDDGIPDAEGRYLKAEAPVLEIGDPIDGCKYPRVWVTERVEDYEGNYRGRTYVMVYPFNEEPDPDGWVALRYGSNYYDEGMGYSDAVDHDTRLECFQAAELFYLHAAEKGNPVAWMNLGYIYSYDRCEGYYYKCWEDYPSWEEFCYTPYPREERAFECFEHAAEAGLAEAMYKLGDMHKNGIGCDPDAQAAFDCYVRAFELGREDPPVVWGSVALRLGHAYENALGCTQSFADALKWYEQAVTGLEIAVRGGDWYYQKALDGAKAGVARCKQELQG